jgi:hypothetical protein
MTVEIIVEGDTTGPSFDFIVRRGSGVIPATFWKANASADPRPPVTLLQHGGPLHKRDERTNGLAQSIVTGTGGAVLLIDGPIHGLRRDDQPELMEMLGIFKQYWQEDAGIDGMVLDWMTVLDAVIEQGWVDAERVAWFGVSMGTAYGIPVCAADDRIKAAAMGMWGTDWGQDVQLLADARAMRTPTLFQIKTGDEIFSTLGQRALFDALGSPNKCLSTYDGGHSLTAPGQLDQLLRFIVRAFGGDHVPVVGRP